MRSTRLYSDANSNIAHHLGVNQAICRGDDYQRAAPGACGKSLPRNPPATGLGTSGLEIADNDYAVGLLLEAVANSPYANNTLVFAIEDDAQDGPGHIDAHRSIAFVADPYVKQRAVVSAHYTTVSMIRTTEEILGLTPSSLMSAAAAPMTEVFDPVRTNWNYTSLVLSILRTTTMPLPAVTGMNSLPNTKRNLQQTYSTPKINIPRRGGKSDSAIGISRRKTNSTRPSTTSSTGWA
jgi:hypothetical protein